MTLGTSGLLGHTPTARPWSRRQDGPSDGGVGRSSSSGGSGGGAAKSIFRRGSLSGLPDRRRNSCGAATSNSWERRSSLYTPSGRDLQETPFRSRLRESTLLDSLTYERALTQLAREKTLNSLSTLRTIESHFESVCTSDATAFLTPRRPPPSASCGSGGGGGGAAAAGGGRDAEGKKLFFRLSAISSASSGPAHNVSDVSISDISASNLPRLFAPHDLAREGSRKSSLYGDSAAGKRYSHGRTEMVLVAPLTRTPTPSPRGRGQDGMDALLEEGARHYSGDQPRKSEFFMPRPHPSEHGNVTLGS